MLLAAERAIVERLKTALDPLPVEALPARGYRFSHAKGAAVVAAVELSAGGVEDTGASAQSATATFEVALFSRSLRDGAGVWDLFDATRLALLSFRPEAGVTPLRLQSARLMEAEADTWTLATRWQCLLPLIPDLDYDGGPLLARVTFEEV
ncbi:MAG: Gp37 family protein [Pseudomonadota bacterium]